MDVSAIVEAESSKRQVELPVRILTLNLKLPCRKAVTVEKDIPIQIDIGLLTALDTNPIDAEAYK